jgi:membrane fusion protein (multidrug efflux system)
MYQYLRYLLDYQLIFIPLIRIPMRVFGFFGLSDRKTLMAELISDADATQVKATDAASKPASVATPSTEPDKNNRKRHLLIFTLLVVGIAAVVAFFYLTQWRYSVSTEDAYVNGNQVQITSQITGTVQAIGVNDTNVVKAGQVLVALDKSDNGLALETAKAQLTTAIRQFKTQSANVQQASTGVTQAQTALNEVASQIEAARVALNAAKADYQRRVALAGMNAVSK